MRSYIVTFLSVLSWVSPLQAFAPNALPKTHTNTLHSNESTSRLQSFSLDIIPSAMSTLDTFYKTAPYEAAFMTCGIKASAADFLAQRREADEKKTEEMVEFDRNIAFILYGGLYQGMAQYYIYNILFPMWFGNGQDIMTVGTQVLFDLAIVSPFLCLPVAYLVKSTIYGLQPVEGLKKYVSDVKSKGLLLKYYRIWFPAQCLTFGVIPEHLRIAFIAFISFFWLIILSTVSSSESAVEKEA